MRILHTSDWHLGRKFHGTSLHETMSRLLDEMINLIDEEKIDVLLISGDVYDQAMPRNESVLLLSQTLTRLATRGVEVVIISGNHDSATRLGFGSQLMKGAGVHLVTSQTEVGQPILIEKQGVSVAFYGIPYLEPRPIAERWEVEPSHQAVLTEAMRRIQADFSQTPADARIVLAHCFAQGARPSDSERNIQVGGAFSVPASLFEAADYTALGHLHGMQQVAPTVRYSGSLLAYSYSEEKHRKGAWILDLDTQGKIQVSDYRWKTKLELKSLTGTLAEVLDPQLQEAYGQAFVRVTLTDPERPAKAHDKLKAAYPYLMEFHYQPSGRTESQRPTYQRRGQEEDQMEVIASFYQHVRDRALKEEEKNYLLKVLEQVRQKRAEA